MNEISKKSLRQSQVSITWKMDCDWPLKEKLLSQVEIVHLRGRRLTEMETCSNIHRSAQLGSDADQCCPTTLRLTLKSLTFSANPAVLFACDFLVWMVSSPLRVSVPEVMIVNMYSSLFASASAFPPSWLWVLPTPYLKFPKQSWTPMFSDGCTAGQCPHSTVESIIKDFNDWWIKPLYL